MFKRILCIGLILIIILAGGLYLAYSKLKPLKQVFLSPLGQAPKPTPISYAAYSFETLAQKQIEPSQIEIGDLIKAEPEFNAYFFFYQCEGQRISGQLNLPKKGNSLPVLIMLRGYADKEIYFTGLGTRKAAGFFAQNGFLTLAPDFLGFGQSDSETSDILLNRFKRPLEVLSLLASITNLNQALEAKGLAVRVDPEQIFLWGHSNGGQIAISVLEISRRPIPTVLWAPVSQAFPESVLQYTSELDDNGKIVIEAINSFRQGNDPGQFSITNYFGQIQAPLQIHQGTGDKSVLETQTQDFYQTLKSLGKQVKLYLYPKDNHNLARNWDKVIKRDLAFFQKYLKIVP